MQTPRNNPISILQQQQEPRPFLPFREADRQQSDLFPLNSKKTHKMQVRGGKKLKKTITNANAKTRNQKFTKIKIKTVKNPSQKNKIKLQKQQQQQRNQAPVTTDNTNKTKRSS
jgi:hypothetical protein